MSLLPIKKGINFSGPTARPFASKKAMTAFLKGLERGLDSRDEMGRNLLSCCALLYRHYSGDRHFQADARRAAKRAGELLAMGISLTQLSCFVSSQGYQYIS